MGCGFGCCVGVGLGGAVDRFGFGFGFGFGWKKSLMSVCRSFLLSVLRICLNCCDRKRSFALRFRGLSCCCCCGLLVLRVLRVFADVFVVVVGFACSLAASLSHRGWSFASFSSLTQSPLTGASMHRSPACGAL